MPFTPAKRLKKTYMTYMLKPKAKSHPTYMPFNPAKRLKKTYMTYMLKPNAKSHQLIHHVTLPFGEGWGGDSTISSKRQYLIPTTPNT